VTLPGLPFGEAGSLDEAKRGFKVAWENFKAKHRPEELANGNEPREQASAVAARSPYSPGTPNNCSVIDLFKLAFDIASLIGVFGSSKLLGELFLSSEQHSPPSAPEIATSAAEMKKAAGLAHLLRPLFSREN
jgi:hypothetical protein